MAEMSADDLPREKVIKKGISTLSNSELIALLLRTGNASESVLDLSKRILHFADGKLNRLSQVTLEQFLTINGIGYAKAITLLAAFELGRRSRCESVTERKVIRSAEDVLEFMQDKNAYAEHEEFWVIYLSQSSKILLGDKISQGGITSTVVDVRLVIKQAINLNATGLVLCHNHPSGRLVPSTQDRQLTIQIKKAAEFLSLKLLDHVIVCQNQYYSMMENGEI